MSNPMNKSKQVALAVIRNNSGKILIIKRVHQEKAFNDQELTWAFPGGRVEEDENPEEAVVREVFLETGFNIVVNGFISERDNPMSGTHLCYFDCSLRDFKVAPIEEIHEIETIKWVSPEEALKYFTSEMESKVAAHLGVN